MTTTTRVQSLASKLQNCIVCNAPTPSKQLTNLFVKDEVRILPTTYFDTNFVVVTTIICIRIELI